MAEQVGDGKINTMASHLLQQVLSDLTGDTALRRERGVLALNRFLNGAIDFLSLYSSPKEHCYRPD